MDALPPTIEATGSGCHGGRETMLAAAGAAGKTAAMDQLDAGLSARPARPAAEHVPGLRLAARRAADAAGGDDPVGQRLLRLRPDLHQPFLRRQALGRLRAVQLRDAGHRQAVRGYPRGGAADRQAGGLRRRRRHQPLRPDRLRRAAGPAAEADRRRAHHRHRRARLRRADACRGQGRARRRHAALCAAGGRGRPGRPAEEPCRGRAHRRADRRAVPGRPGRHRRAAGAAGPVRRAADAGAGMARPVRRAGQRRRRRGASLLHRQHPRIPRRRPSCRRLRPGRRRGHGGVAGGDRPRGEPARRAHRPGQGAGAAGGAGGARRPPDQRPRHRLRLRGHRNCWSPGCWSRPAPRCPMSAPPARAPNGPRPTAPGSPRAACMSSTAPAWNRTWRRWRR